ncbi:hypothetical protein [Candidatus Poriferisodalis sp.]|uniref:hypothetical protein n=1 Tax=Candidatus Poriferisodalis sp. TaxID=3101277 RepID=UPI003B013A70
MTMQPASAIRTIVEGPTRPPLAACPTNEDDHFTDETPRIEREENMTTRLVTKNRRSEARDEHL